MGATSSGSPISRPKGTLPDMRLLATGAMHVGGDAVLVHADRGAAHEGDDAALGRAVVGLGDAAGERAGGEPDQGAGLLARDDGAAARKTVNVPLRWVSMTGSHSSSDMLKSIRSRRMPATQTTPSMRP